MSIKQRLESQIHIDPATECWNWLGGKRKGYASIYVRGKNCKASRVSYEAYCTPIPSGLNVLHRCDNPACINPKHLFLGSQADNVADMIAKGRHARGSKKRSAKLSEADVLAIRAEVSLTPKQMAEKYNISLSRIYLIRMGKSWAHLLETRAG